MAKLNSGNPYSLSEIFTGENDKIVIPDLQRDYCWGNPFTEGASESLVTSFMESLVHLDRKTDITMGLIYGFYDELTPYHLQLCDGQQRLTTLFLIIGMMNRRLEDNRFRDILISNFELHEDDGEPHLLYGIRESSLYFLSDLTTRFFLVPSIATEDIEDQHWFLNSYKQDSTILSILIAIRSIEKCLDAYLEPNELPVFGDFLLNHLKFLFYDMNNRQNGEETFVVINTTGEPLSANQNLKPLVIMENPDYVRIDNVTGEKFSTSKDWEEMETWFWQHRHRNNVDTANEGMLAFLHCVRVLSCVSERDWFNVIEVIGDKFPVKEVSMECIWDWFCAYKRIVETDFSRLHSSNISYPNTQVHYTQKDLYSLLPTMLYCKKFPNATDISLQRIYHLFYNMSRYRTTTRSSQKDSVNVPAYRACRLVEELMSDDILSILKIDAFDVDEEIGKLRFLQFFSDDSDARMEVEQLFSQAESWSVYNGRIATLINWSTVLNDEQKFDAKVSIDEFKLLFQRVKCLFYEKSNLNPLRRALLAYGVKHYPMSIGQTNRTLCAGEEWRKLFEYGDPKLQSFVREADVDTLISEFEDQTSPYYLLIKNGKYLDFSQNHRIRIHALGVIELMEKEKASADFILFHRGVAFRKTMVNMNAWHGFWAWSNDEFTVFYAMSARYNLTLDMQILESGYRIVAWLDRRPVKKTLPTIMLQELGFVEEEGQWAYHIINDPNIAKQTFINFTESLS